MTAHSPGIVPGSVFVVSGGARGIGAHCVAELARRYRLRFVLLGRTRIDSPEPVWALGCTSLQELVRRAVAEHTTRGERVTPVVAQRAASGILARREVAATLEAVKAAGGDARYCAVDVSDRTALHMALPPLLADWGPAAGLVHAAGVLSDKPIERKTGADFDAVYRAKVVGLANLLGTLAPHHLRHLVLFASAAGFYGNPGQADYALANQVLDRAAYRLRQALPDCHVVALDWGPWDGGMVTPTVKQHFSERGIEVIPVLAGVRALIDVLERTGADRDATQIVIGNALPRSLAIRPAPAPGPQAPVRRLRRKLSLAANPFLRDHVLGGRAVLPAVCAMSWIANACEDLYPEYRFFRAEDFRVLKGLVFDADLADEHLLEATLLSTADPDSIALTVTISSAVAGRPRYHYRAQVTLVRTLPEPPLYDRFDLTEDAASVPGERLYESGTFFHGPAFRGVERVLNVSRERLTLRCSLPALGLESQGQFPARTFNPYLADTLFQAMLAWTQHFQQVGALPQHAERGEVFRRMPFDQRLYVSLEVRSSTEHRLVADSFAHDERGRLYMQVLGAEVTPSERLNRPFVAAVPQPV
jgi:NAD(P)-dependent dehydrogenase (short-subunit alcohol dehydrogenase family)